MKTLDWVKGVLVKEKKTGHLGIVLDDRRTHLTILQGDGLTMQDLRSNWEPVPYGPNMNFPACFAELLPVGWTDLTTDVRGRVLDVERELEGAIKDQFSDLERRLSALEGIKEAVTVKLSQ